MRLNLKTKLALLLLAATATLSACKKLYDLPEEKDYMSFNVNYPVKDFSPIIGRTGVFGTFNADYSTYPITFEIVNARFGDGRPVTDLFQKAQTLVWTAPYTGLEKSLSEIETKRKLESHSLFEVRSSGEFILWNSSTNQLITPRAEDSTNYSQNTRFFDLKIKNTGGERLIKDFQIKPFRERPYEPSNDFNHYTGRVPLDTAPDVRANRIRAYNRPSYLFNVVGAESSLPLNRDEKIAYKYDVVVYIRPFTGGNGHSLRIKALGKDSLPINPSKFNQTQWADMLHGFNMQKTDTYVQYDVAYPIPLTDIPTRYASGGRARAELSYARIGFGGDRVTATAGINFAIYKTGDWEVVFHFRRENPKFEDE